MTDVSLSLKGVHGPYLVALVRAADGTGEGHLMALDPLGTAMTPDGPTWTDAWGIPRELRASIGRRAVRVMGDGSLRVRTSPPTGRRATAAEVAELASRPSEEPPQEAGLAGIAVACHGLDAAVLSSNDATGFTAWSLRNGESVRFEGDGACAIHSPCWSAGKDGSPVITFQARTPDDADITAGGGLAAIARQAQSTAGGIGLRRGAPQIARAIGQGGDTVFAWRGEGFLRVASPTLSASALVDLRPYSPRSIAFAGFPFGASLAQLVRCDAGEPGRPALRVGLRKEARASRTIADTGADGAALAYAIATAEASDEERQDALEGVLRLIGASTHG